MDTSNNSLVFCSRDPGVKTEKPKVSSTPSTSRPAVTSSSRAPPRPRPGPSQEQSDNIVRRTPGASGAVRRRPEEPRRSTLAKRSSTVSSVRLIQGVPKNVHFSGFTVQEPLEVVFRNTLNCIQKVPLTNTFNMFTFSG